MSIAETFETIRLDVKRLEKKVDAGLVLALRQRALNMPKPPLPNPTLAFQQRPEERARMRHKRRG